MKQIVVKIAVAVLALWSCTAFAAGEVKLLKVQSTQSYYKGYWTSGRFEVLVANLAFQKNVHLHIRQKSGVWTDYPLSYNRPANNGKEVWTADFTLYNQPTDADELLFAVKYQVNGQTFWDNNNGANYRFTRNFGNVLVGTNVYNGLYQTTLNLYGGNTVHAYVTIKNLAANKVVKVVYSTDNWLTAKTVYASYDPQFWNSSYSTISNPNAYGFEEWRFQMDVGSSSTKVDYAISYTVNGQTYWDNNFGRNYAITLIR